MKKDFTSRSSSIGSFLLSRYYLFIFAFLFITHSNSFSQNSVALVVNPAISSVEVNEVFTVDVLLDFSSGSLSAVDAYVNFNPLDLEVTAEPIVPAATLAALPSISVNFSPVATMNSLGQVDYGRFNTGAIGTHPNADFVLFTISFRALRVPPGGTTSISFNTVPVRQSLAVESGLPILSGTSDGTVNISAIGCTTPTATISAPGGTTTCNSQTFNLILASATGESPFDVTIDGPNGSATYNDITVGSPITSFVPPTLNIFATPSPVTYTDNVYTLGIRFTSSVSGFVRGVRFYGAEEGSAAPGNYTGQLWTDGGTLLTSGVFTGVTTEAWNELIFPQPILITPGTTYVASYHTGSYPAYASTPNGLVGAVTNGPLTALAGGGVFNQSGTPTFPTQTVQGNYWVDVLFSPNQYSFDLTGVTDANGCVNTGALQTLSITSVDCATLPVSLLGLSATPKDNSVVLKWSTASEINNKGFEVQRKTETGDWVAIGFVQGSGSSQSTHYYDYTDNNLQPNRYYYRLKQVDIDGRFEYSPVVSAVIGSAEKFSLEQNYPNPFRSETVIRFTLPGKTNVKLSLYDIQGRLVRTLVNGSRDKGTHAVTVNSTTLTSGLYYYKLESENFSAVKKMTIQ